MTTHPPAAGARHMLSAYLAPPDATGLAAVRHDHCVALWRVSGDEVSLVRYWELERVTGHKHHRFPLGSVADTRLFLDSLLAEVGLRLDDMSAVWGTPGLASDDDYLHIAHTTGLPAHSIAHVFSSLLLDWDKFRHSTILALALDAGPDWTLDRRPGRHGYAGCVSVNGRLTFFPIESPGLLWYLARKRLGREEGTLMALASASSCRVDADVSAWVDQVPMWGPAQAATGAEGLLDRIINLVRSTPVDDLHPDPRFDLEDNRQSAIMKLVDAASIEVVDRTVRRICHDTGVDPASAYLALSGGYALNCPNNTRMMDEFGFRGLLAPPCVNDGGQALGLGLMGLHAGGITATGRFSMTHAYHGNDQLRLDEALKVFEPFIESVTAADPEQALDDLAESPIAWVHAAAELGPRALGHRSLLGDPTVARTKDQINQLKRRQWWRPVAPVVLEPHSGEWFGHDRPSPYMLEAMRCRPELAARIPAALHLDGSARLQTLGREQEPLLYDLIDRFRLRTGVPMLCNTSLNDRGEPIVDDAVQALNFCVRRGVRTAYVAGRRIRLLTAPPVGIALPVSRQTRSGPPPAQLAARGAELWQQLSDQGLDPELIFVAATNPGYRARLSRAMSSPDAGERRRVRLLGQRLLNGMAPEERRLLDYSLAKWGPSSSERDAGTGGIGPLTSIEGPH